VLAVVAQRGLQTHCELGRPRFPQLLKEDAAEAEMTKRVMARRSIKEERVRAIHLSWVIVSELRTGASTLAFHAARHLESRPGRRYGIPLFVLLCGTLGINGRLDAPPNNFDKSSFRGFAVID
jgi:hypothetical protein